MSDATTRRAIPGAAAMVMSTPQRSALPAAETDAMISVRDEAETFHLQLERNGTPGSVARWMTAAQELAWPLPRFEAGDWTAAFVAAAKPRPVARGDVVQRGGLVFLAGTGPRYQGPAFRYEVFEAAGRVRVRALQRQMAPSGQGNPRYGLLFTGELVAFKRWAGVETPPATAASYGYLVTGPATIITGSALLTADETLQLQQRLRDLQELGLVSRYRVWPVDPAMCGARFGDTIARLGERLGCKAALPILAAAE